MSQEEQRVGRRSMRAAAIRTRQKISEICCNPVKHSRTPPRSFSNRAHKRQKENDSETNNKKQQSFNSENQDDFLQPDLVSWQCKENFELERNNNEEQKENYQVEIKNQQKVEENKIRLTKEDKKFDFKQLICQNPMKQIGYEFLTSKMQVKYENEKIVKNDQKIDLFIEKYSPVFVNLKEYQQNLYNSNFMDYFFDAIVLGVDEAGRGPLAGPVVAACCYVPLHVEIEGIQDSKKITSESKRKQICDKIINHPEIQFAISVIEPSEIDKINILQASLKAMKNATEELVEKIKQKENFEGFKLQGKQNCEQVPEVNENISPRSNQKLQNQDLQEDEIQVEKENQNSQQKSSNLKARKQVQNQSDDQLLQKTNDKETNLQQQSSNLSPQNNKNNNNNNIQNINNFYLLVDGTFAPQQIKGIDKQNVKTVVKGDSKCYCIAAASIIAKVHRDNLMVDIYDKKFPMYGFKEHKGYPTQKHLKLLQKYGLCEIHRKCYGPVAKVLQSSQQQQI